MTNTFCCLHSLHAFRREDLAAIPAEAYSLGCLSWGVAMAVEAGGKIRGMHRHLEFVI